MNRHFLMHPNPRFANVIGFYRAAKAMPDQTSAGGTNGEHRDHMVRFNLDKEDDRRLFELLQKRSMPRKRNEFLKKVLLKYMTEEAGGKSGARPTKKQSKGALQAETLTSQHDPKIASVSRLTLQCLSLYPMSRLCFRRRGELQIRPNLTLKSLS